MVATDLILDNPYERRGLGDMEFATRFANLIAVLETEQNVPQGCVDDIFDGSVTLSQEAQKIAGQEIENSWKRVYAILTPNQHVIIQIAELLSEQAGNKVGANEIEDIIANMRTTKIDYNLSP